MILILDNILNILQSKNLENAEIVDLCKILFDLINNFILKICDVTFQNLHSLIPVNILIIYYLNILFLLINRLGSISIKNVLHQNALLSKI